MSLLQSIKARLGFGESRSADMEYMPKERREAAIPKFKLRKDVNAQGQIYLPKDVRTFDNRSDIEKGSAFSLDVFVGNHTEMYVDVSVISGHRITIPAEVRHKLDIREGDTIAVHGYWQEADE